MKELNIKWAGGIRNSTLERRKEKFWYEDLDYNKLLLFASPHYHCSEGESRAAVSGVIHNAK